MTIIADRDRIRIRPATPDDKRTIFEWLAHSNLTKEMLGPPTYPDAEIPAWEEFDRDYQDHYFTGSSPLDGQSFIIEVSGLSVGHINHNRVDTERKTTDLDIWLSDREHTGKGIGTAAIELMCNFLKEKYGCRQIKISPSKRNKKAIRAYEKAGFVISDRKPVKSEMDYEDNIVMVKEFK